MNTPESVPSVSPREQKGEHQGTTPEGSRVGYRTRKRTERRFEVGLFLRKIVNGVLEYVKGVKGGTATPQAKQAKTEPSGAHGAASRPRALQAGSRDATSSETPSVEEQSGHSRGSDPGPIEDTRYEAGVFLRTVTESADGDDTETS